MTNKEIGNKYEKTAMDYLNSCGFIILNHQYRCSFGEIDIIAKDNDTIIFVEVKFRSNIKNGYPREAVNLTKQNKIKLVAQNYIIENNIVNCNFRFDVIEILGKVDFEIEHIENAFY